jgi:hypothetical protein
MATYKFTQVKGVGRQQRFEVEEKRYPNHAANNPTLPSNDQMQLRAGKPGQFPTGLDTSAPRIYPRGC